MVEFQNVHVSFTQNNTPVHAVKDASFAVASGEIFGIVGTSGAGKSTLLRTINLLQQVTSGKVLVDGEDIVSYKGAKLRRLRQNIGMIFQHFHLAESKTVYSNIAFVLESSGWKKPDIDRRVRELLEFVKLSDKIHEYPARLSGGQKQRVAIARALANNTRILLCDEPTSALDAETTAKVLSLLQEINERFQITIILITHELDVVKAICNRVAVMHDGHVVEVGDVYDVFSNPQSSYAHQLLEHTRNFEIPEEIRKNVKGPVFKLTYQGESAAKAILSEITASCGAHFNILHGKIEYINSKPLGILYVNITGFSEDVNRAVELLRYKVADVEAITYA